jgi:hypothetical protein
MRVRIARDELRRIRELSQAIKALEAEIAQLVAQIAPQLLTELGLGPLTARRSSIGRTAFRCAVCGTRDRLTERSSRP